MLDNGRLAASLFTATVAVMTIGFIGCGGPAKAPGQATGTAASASRFPASVKEEASNNEAWEKEFQEIVNDSLPSIKVRENLIENLLGTLYRAEAYIEAFEKELDLQVAKVQADPNYQADMIDTDAYKRVHTMHVASIDYTNRLTYIYARLLETQKDSAQGADVQKRAQDAIVDIDQTLMKMPKEDRLLLLDLIEHFRKIRKDFKAAANDTNGGRDVASTDAPFANDEYSDEAKLKADVKATAAITREKAAKALKASYPAIDKLAAEVPPLPTGDRKPTAFAPYAPGPGPTGNVIGTGFPQGVWALTLDDGPHPQYTPAYMDALLAHRDNINTHGAPASFMWISQNVGLYPSVVQRAVASGFSTNCHSWTHMLLNHASHDQRVHEVTDAVHFNEKAFGRKMRFYRCPGGNCYAPAIPEVRQMIADLGLLHAYWSLDSQDWFLKDAARTFALVTKQMTVQKRGVILMHDIHPYSLEAAKMLLNWIGKQNNSGATKIRLMTLDDAVDLYNKSGGAQ